jgi:hypothetical protein
MAAVDREIVDQLAALSVDCTLLPHQIIANNHTELTAMYRILKRKRMTEAMNGFTAAAPPGGVRPTLIKKPILGRLAVGRPAGGFTPTPAARPARIIAVSPIAEAPVQFWKITRPGPDRGNPTLTPTDA